MSCTCYVNKSGIIQGTKAQQYHNPSLLDTPAIESAPVTWIKTTLSLLYKMI